MLLLLLWLLLRLRLLALTWLAALVELTDSLTSSINCLPAAPTSRLPLAAPATLRFFPVTALVELPETVA